MWTNAYRHDHSTAYSMWVLLLVTCLYALPAHANEQMPDLTMPTAQWLNSPPLGSEQLRGKVVLVEFWTYTCINCLRTLPYVKEWSEKYRSQGLVVVGVHTPEFPFEKDKGNVERALQKLGITYPVVMDNQYQIWNAYQNRYWPTQYLIDTQGQIRYQHIGEGAYQKTEEMIRTLLIEASPSLHIKRQE